jgi:RNA polymerase sigma factor (sigma-70 family)
MVEDGIDIDALKSGDDEAFRKLVEMFQDRVFNTCLGFLESREEAEDVAQETFVEVHRSIKGFRGDARLSTWIYRIAATKSLQVIRSKRRKKRFAFFLRGRESNDVMESVADPADNNHPLAQIENKERAEIVYSAIDKLPDSQRVACILNKIEGLSYEEVADVMNVSLSSVESLLHRAKSNLRKSLRVYYGGI